MTYLFGAAIPWHIVLRLRMMVHRIQRLVLCPRRTALERVGVIGVVAIAGVPAVRFLISLVRAAVGDDDGPSRNNLPPHGIGLTDMHHTNEREIGRRHDTHTWRPSARASSAPLTTGPQW